MIEENKISAQRDSPVTRFSKSGADEKQWIRASKEMMTARKEKIKAH